MIRTIAPLWLLASLAACGDGQPLYEDESAIGTVVEELPPGTENPQASGSIFRYEARNEVGGGLATDMSLDEDANTFSVDNLGFDGANVYQRDGAFVLLYDSSATVPAALLATPGATTTTLGGNNVYFADDLTPDFLTGAPVGQIVPYRAIHGRSNVLVGEPGEEVPRGAFSIVRTGGYADFGYGGFSYERNGPVVLGGTGQAQWSGRYGALRTYSPVGGLEYSEGDVLVAIDFEDFNANDAVMGVLYNRVRYDSNGLELDPFSDIDGYRVLPSLPFEIVEGVETVLETGEFAGELFNQRYNPFTGKVEVYEQGVFHGVIAGDITGGENGLGDGGEVIGVYVVEAWSPFVREETTQETGGFIIERSRP